MPEIDIKALFERIRASNLSDADKAVASIAVGQSWSTILAAAMPEMLRPGYIEESKRLLAGFGKALEQLATVGT